MSDEFESELEHWSSPDGCHEDCPACEEEREENATPSEKAAREYLAAPFRCPHCKSKNISGGKLDVDESRAWQDVECGDCGKEWKDVYILDAIETIEGKPFTLDEDEEVQS